MRKIILGGAFVTEESESRPVFRGSDTTGNSETAKIVAAAASGGAREFQTKAQMQTQTSNVRAFHAPRSAMAERNIPNAAEGATVKGIDRSALQRGTARSIPFQAVPRAEQAQDASTVRPISFQTEQRGERMRDVSAAQSIPFQTSAQAEPTRTEKTPEYAEKKQKKKTIGETEGQDRKKKTAPTAAETQGSSAVTAGRSESRSVRRPARKFVPDAAEKEKIKQYKQI